MSAPNDKVIAWQGRIQEKVGQATKAIVDRLVSMPKSGFSQLSPSERRDAHETIAKEIADVMYRLGTFVTAGAQDFQVCHLEGVNIGKGGKVACKLIPVASEGGPINLELLAANADKQVVLAYINGVAYQQAREALTKAIHREQTDWVNRREDEAAEEVDRALQTHEGSSGVLTATANAQVTNIKTQATGELIADQPGETDGEGTEGEGEVQAELYEAGSSEGHGSDGWPFGDGRDSGAPGTGADGEGVPELPVEGTSQANDMPAGRGRRGGPRARGIQPTH